MKIPKTKIIQAIQSSRLIPLFHHDDVDLAKNVLDACYKGGIQIFEFAHRGPKAFETFQELKKQAAGYKNFYLGVGTVMNAAMARQYIEAGAQFLVSPIFKHEIADVVNAEEMIWIPGCATMTEITIAFEAGAEIIKIFPGSVLGPGFVSAVLPIIPKLRLMPTGGVELTEANLSSWFKAGVFCVGMGSHLFPKDLMDAKNWKGIEDRVREVLKIISEL